jgi:hypothetical protein
MKFRVLETKDKLFFPQCKVGLFWGWQFLEACAATSSLTLWRALLTKDYADAASFISLEEAEEFIKQFKTKVENAKAAYFASVRRQNSGVGPTKKHTPRIP